MSDVRLSTHAQIRKEQMALTDDEVAAVSHDPELVYPALAQRDGPMIVA